jgi:hypothetical protein
MIPQAGLLAARLKANPYLHSPNISVEEVTFPDSLLAGFDLEDSYFIFRLCGFLQSLENHLG